MRRIKSVRQIIVGTRGPVRPHSCRWSERDWALRLQSWRRCWCRSGGAGLRGGCSVVPKDEGSWGWLLWSFPPLRFYAPMKNTEVESFRVYLEIWRPQRVLLPLITEYRLSDQPTYIDHNCHSGQNLKNNYLEGIIEQPKAGRRWNTIHTWRKYWLWWILIFIVFFFFLVWEQITVDFLWAI